MANFIISKNNTNINNISEATLYRYLKQVKEEYESLETKI